MKYVTKGEVSVELFERIGGAKLTPRASTTRLYVAGFIFIIGGFGELAAGYFGEITLAYVVGAIFLFLGVAVFLSMPKTRERFLKITKDRFLESVPAGRLMMSVTFLDENIEIRRLDTEGVSPGIVEYENVKEIAEVVESNFDGAPVFMGTTDSGSSFYVFLGTLDEADRKKLMKFLADKGIKVIGIHKAG